MKHSVKLGAIAALSAASMLMPLASFAAPSSSDGTATTDTVTSAQSSVECISGRSFRMANKQNATVPVKNSSRDCWLDIDQNNYNSGAYWLQYSLRYANGKSIGVDGYYGPATANAVWEIQRDKHLFQDSVYGYNTGWAMNWKTPSGVSRW